jgi:dihydroorotate dehydrogenase (NAD+) catalytic subunit
MISSIGLPNPGLEGFLAGDLNRLVELPVPLIVSVMASSAEHFIELVEGVSAVEGVAGIELNVSCPNVHSGLIVGEQPDETLALMDKLRPRTSLPLIVKLTPNVANPDRIAVAAEEGGADAVSDQSSRPPGSTRTTTGPGSSRRRRASGPVRPIALAQTRTVSSAVQIPVIGMGGITDGESALEFILAVPL